MGYNWISELGRCLSSTETNSRISLRLKARGFGREEIKSNVLNIKLTAMFWSNWKKGESFICKEDDSNIRICYATHSSFSEIHDFLTYLKPKKVYLNVIPTDFVERHEMMRNLAKIEETYHKTETPHNCDVPRKRFTFKRVREATTSHASKIKKVCNVLKK